MGVNDLADQWDDPERANGERYIGKLDCVTDLVMIQQTAWHPVSEPPTEADGDNDGLVVVHGNGSTDHMHWECIADPNPALAMSMWARIRDVVLMPESDDGTC